MLRRTAGEVLKKSPNDVVVLSAVRSPIARAFKGGFKDTYPEEILMPVSPHYLPIFLKAAVKMAEEFDGWGGFGPANADDVN